MPRDIGQARLVAGEEVGSRIVESPLAIRRFPLSADCRLRLALRWQENEGPALLRVDGGFLRFAIPFNRLEIALVAPQSLFLAPTLQRVDG